MYEQLVLGGDKWWTKHSVKLGLTSKWFILKIIIFIINYYYAYCLSSDFEYDLFKNKIILN